jgi:hypothetical protein
MFAGMATPPTPATLTAEQVIELNKKLSHMRHEINNQLAMVVAALELLRFRSNRPRSWRRSPSSPRNSKQPSASTAIEAPAPPAPSSRDPALEL